MRIKVQDLLIAHKVYFNVSHKISETIFNLLIKIQVKELTVETIIARDYETIFKSKDDKFPDLVLKNSEIESFLSEILTKEKENIQKAALNF